VNLLAKSDSLGSRATGNNYRDVILERTQNSKKAASIADFGFRIADLEAWGAGLGGLLNSGFGMLSFTLGI
jgi:hypothetical protein